MSETAQVETEEAGLRLDRWFKRRYPALGHGPLEKLLRTGQVRIDGKRAKAADRVEPGQSIRIPPQLKYEQPPKLPHETSLNSGDRSFMEGLVIHQDSSIFVL